MPSHFLPFYFQLFQEVFLKFLNLVLEKGIWSWKIWLNEKVLQSTREKAHKQNDRCCHFFKFFWKERQIFSIYSKELNFTLIFFSKVIEKFIFEIFSVFPIRIGSKTYWLIHWLTHWFIDSSIDWLIDLSIDLLTYRLIDWFIYWLIDWCVLIRWSRALPLWTKFIVASSCSPTWTRLPSEWALGIRRTWRLSPTGLFPRTLYFLAELRIDCVRSSLVINSVRIRASIFTWDNILPFFLSFFAATGQSTPLSGEN